MRNRVRAIRFEQNDRVFYTAVIPVARLLEITAVAVWQPGAPEVGYQRAPSQARKNQIAKYLEQDDAVLPLGGLLNARPKDESKPSYGSVVDFEADDPASDGPIQSGWISLPSSQKPWWIVDMQHRLGGLETAIAKGNELEDFPVVVTVADGLARLEEIEQFELINTTQKKVRTDLARRLLAIQAQHQGRRHDIDMAGRLWEAKGPAIVDWLNENSKEWRGKIIQPNTLKRDRPDGIARETSFVTSLKPVLNTPLLSRVPELQVAELLGSYWAALASIWPDAFANPDDFVIQKTSGYFALHQIAPDVLELARQSSGLNEEALKQAVKPLAELGSEYWHKTEGTAAQFGGMKGFAILAAELRAYLPEIDLSLE